MNKIQRLIVTGATAVGGIVGGIVGHNRAEEFAENKIEMYAKQGKTPQAQQERRQEMTEILEDTGRSQANVTAIGGGIVSGALATFLLVGGGMWAATRKKEAGYGTPKNKKGNSANP